MQCYVTFDATTYGVRRGIMHHKSERSKQSYVTINGKGDWYPDKFCFVKYGSAVKNAEKQRQAKIQQLEKQIERIKRMEFK